MFACTSDVPPAIAPTRDQRNACCHRPSSIARGEGATLNGNRLTLAEEPKALDQAHVAIFLRQEVVRRRAYAIWNREGQPDGQADRHWSMAEQELQTLLGASPAGSLTQLRSGDYMPYETHS